MKTIMPVELATFSRVIFVERLLSLRAEFYSHIVFVTGAPGAFNAWQQALSRASNDPKAEAARVMQLRASSGMTQVSLVSAEEWCRGHTALPQSSYAPMAVIDLEECAPDLVAQLMSIAHGDLNIRVLADPVQSRTLIERSGRYVGNVDGRYCSASLASAVGRALRDWHAASLVDRVDAAEQEFFPEPARVLINDRVCWQGSERGMREVYQHLTGRCDSRSDEEWMSVRKRLEAEAKGPLHGRISLQNSDANGRWIQPPSKTDCMSPEGYRLFSFSQGEGVLRFSWLTHTGAAVRDKAVTREDIDAAGGLPHTRRLVEVDGKLIAVERVLRLSSNLLMLQPETVGAAPRLYKYSVCAEQGVRFAVLAPELDDFHEVPSLAVTAPLKHFLANEEIYLPTLPVTGVATVIHDATTREYTVMDYVDGKYELISAGMDQEFVTQHELFARFRVPYAKTLHEKCLRDISVVRSRLLAEAAPRRHEEVSYAAA